MKPNELRIGNWVKNGNAYEAQVTIEILKVAKIFNPIPLTEEWLLKFGFKPFVKDWSLHGVVIHTRKRGFVLRKSVPIIQYVHQLQNLYFALTGEEL